MEKFEEDMLTEKYSESVVLEGFEEFSKHITDRKKAFDELQKERIKQDLNFAIRNKLFRNDKQWPYEAHLEEYNRKWNADEFLIAKKYGHKEKQPTTKEKFEEFKKQFGNSEQVFEKIVKPDKKEKFDIDAKQEEFLEFKKQFQTELKQKTNEKPSKENSSKTEPDLTAKQEKFSEAINQSKDNKKAADKTRQNEAKELFVKEMKQATKKAPEIGD
jgi:hypothetical protein